MHYLSASFKNLLLAFCVSATALSAQAQWVSIPDTNFGKWLNTNGYVNCLQGNSSIGWEMDTTCNEVVNATVINCSYSNKYHTLEGVQYFDNLRELYCSNIQLNVLPALPRSLKYLHCGINKITSLPALPDSLYYLSCHSNQLTSLPVLPNSLTRLLCGDNKILSLPTLPNSLGGLLCEHNQLTSLPSLPSSLTELWCYENQLTLLPMLPDSLRELYCRNNPNLSCLPKLGFIEYLNFTNTAVTCLPNYPTGNIVSNPSLDSIQLCNVFNPNGCAVDVSISDIGHFTPRIELFPNPTNDVVYVSYSSNTSAEATLFNINGATCLKQQLTASNQSISLSGLPAGVYFVSVASGDSVVRKKVVKW